MNRRTARLLCKTNHCSFHRSLWLLSLAHKKMSFEDLLKGLTVEVKALTAETKQANVRLTAVQEEVKEMNVRLTAVQEDVKELKVCTAELTLGFRVLAAKQANGTKGLHDKLHKVPTPKGDDPDLFPDFIAQLTVSGAERMPASPNRPGWNKIKSLRCIRQYVPDEPSDDEGDDEEATARERRLKLAQILGVTEYQMAQGFVAAQLKKK